ncbi:hypothetical protein ABFS82_11G022200 [Erythranthe guttata]|uniref:Transmembrane protein n=1 Tax=Erythranthe guttata TaxID=4155 RepID=A0A022PWX9_ERYGU|nr:PREDICTED: uncharacterized protein LOC105976546 [Erythranthe guttata]EYU20877.1 hypothetical protein MIMGU_mgv1a017313mg [Erythranthe guttata]|eukprot:XP_012857234.1 PREDICTED: uncharacterized protein LOC105976546 [Erythranthe guttata]
MAFRQRQLVAVLLLYFFLLMVTSSAVPISRSLKTFQNQVSVTYFPYQDVKMEKLVEGRMEMELADYPGTGANHNHDPTPPRT